MNSVISKLNKALPCLLLLACSSPGLAAEINVRRGVTDMSQRIQDLHHLSLLICVVMAVLVFGVMFYSIFAHRRSRHPKPADFHESHLVEFFWTLIPILILIGLAIPATH